MSKKCCFEIFENNKNQNCLIRFLGFRSGTNYRLFDRYDRHAASFAVLGDADTKWRPSGFRQKLMDCEVIFRFPTVKLTDYEYEELEKSDNPFAIVVMAHLKTLETAKDDPRRMKKKLAIIRHLYRKGFSRQDILNLFRFIDWIMYLPEDMDHLFSQELETEEKEGKMPYITSVERLGYKRGKLEAIELGLEIKFGKQGLQLMDKISKIGNLEILNAICEGLKKVSAIEELRQIYEN